MLAWAFSTWFGASHSSCPGHIHQWRQNSSSIIDGSYSIPSSLVHLNSPFPICPGICIPLFDCVLGAWVHSYSGPRAWAMNSAPEAWDKAVILSLAPENESVTFKAMCSPWFGNCLFLACRASDSTFINLSVLNATSVYPGNIKLVLLSWTNGFMLHCSLASIMCVSV